MTATLADAVAGLSDRHVHSGKVRELFAVGQDLLLMVASDRISAFDYILPTEIPDKGAVLTKLSLWWFDQLADVVPNHVVTADVSMYPAEVAPYADALRDRSVLCRRLDMVTVECVARGYLTGGGYKDYAASGSVCGIQLPVGLLDGSRLPEPIFTPTTKAPVGQHDEAMSFAAVVAAVGAKQAAELRDLTLAIYSRAAAIAADAWKPGQAQPSYDKQYVRDWLLNASGWDRKSSPPPLPADVVAQTRAKYVDAYERLTGHPFLP
jgi:phosphoribosylaminoimidazole-succinocarboxamide synthase